MKLIWTVAVVAIPALSTLYIDINMKKLSVNIKRTYGYIRIIPMLILSCFVLSCASVDSDFVFENNNCFKKGGIFRYRWWNYYQRGVCYANAEEFDKAIKDFEEAKKQRDKDQYMARGYGVHFIDYFPNREMGIVYYYKWLDKKNLTISEDLKEMLEKAESSIKKSIDDESTDRAREYLNVVRKEFLNQEKDKLSKISPLFIFDEKVVWTRDDPVVFTGTIEDESYVSRLEIHGGPFFLNGSQKKVRFKKILFLPQGDFDIKITAENLREESNSASIKYHVDRNGPTFSISELSSVTSDKKIFIKGIVRDHRAGVSKLKINGKLIPIKAGKNVEFKETVNISENEIILEAYDRLENETVLRLPLSDRLIGGNHKYYAQANSQLHDMMSYQKQTLNDTSKNIEIIFNGFFKNRNNEDTEYNVFNNEIIVDGRIKGKVQKLSIIHNGKEHNMNQFLQYSPPFQMNIELNKGVNTIILCVNNIKITERKVIYDDELSSILRHKKAKIGIFCNKKYILEQIENDMKYKEKGYMEKHYNDTVDFISSLKDSIDSDNRLIWIPDNIKEKPDFILHDIKIKYSKYDKKNRFYDCDIVVTMSTNGKPLKKPFDVFGTTQGEYLSTLGEKIPKSFYDRFPILKKNIISCEARDVIKTNLGEEDYINISNVDWVEYATQLIIYNPDKIRYSEVKLATCKPIEKNHTYAKLDKNCFCILEDGTEQCLVDIEKETVLTKY